MVVVSGDRSDLCISHCDLGIKRREFQMLLVFLGAVVAARERQDQWIVPLKLAKPAKFPRVIGQLVVRKNTSGRDIVTHVRSPFGALRLPLTEGNIVL